MSTSITERPPKNIVICADDFAFNPSVSEGIAKLAEAGRISATSAMVLSPRWAADAALIRHFPHHSLDVGLHLDLTSAFACTNGVGYPLHQLMVRALLGQLNVPVMTEIIVQQLNAFEAVWQRPPDHVDGHQHVHQFAGVREALVHTLHARYPKHCRPYVRISKQFKSTTFSKMAIVSAMGASRLQVLCQQAQIAYAPYLEGAYAFQAHTDYYAKRMRQWLASAVDNTLLMCHPAQSALTGDAIGPARENEFNYLISKDFSHDLRQKNVQLMQGKTIYQVDSDSEKQEVRN